MKKAIISIILITLILLGFNHYLTYQLDQNIRDYQAQNKYEAKYPISDYVDNKTDASIIQQKTIISGMIDSEDFINETSNLKRVQYGFNYIFNRNFEINQLLNDLQYQEAELLIFDELPPSEQNEYHNYEYIGYDQAGEQVQGYASLYEVDGNYSIAISFLNSDYTVNQSKAKLLADDSNAEKMAYDIIRETQEIYQSNYSPEKASEFYYNSTIEQIAGAISYHAIVTLIIDEYEVESDALIRAATTDISLIDSDAFFVNRAY